MKKLALLLMLIISALALFSCGEESHVPDGMQTVDGGMDKGFYFYAPEEWTVSNLNGVSAAYVSRLDTTSVSFSEINPSEFKKPDPAITDEDYFFSDYFSDSFIGTALTPTVTVNGEATLFGKGEEKADKAVKYAFSYEYDGHTYGFMQIFIKEGKSFYVFQYAALMEERLQGDGKTSYDYYLEKMQTVIDNFRFFEKADGENDEKAEYETDSDGYNLVSEKKLCGFDFYAPRDFTLDFSSAIVSVTHEDGSNVNMTEAMKTGLTAEAYWKQRQTELMALVTDLEIIKENEAVSLGNNSQWAFAYEYTFTYNGEKYHVYQINAVDGPLLLADGYCFTYTAKEENYSKHIDKVQKIIDKVVF